MFKTKSGPIKSLLENIVGKKIDGKSCAFCNSVKITQFDFRDELSYREFTISRLCQKCQDEVFGPEDEEEN